MPAEPSPQFPNTDDSSAKLRREAFATSQPPKAHSSIDPLVHSSFREALLVGGIWFVAMIWSISVCYFTGYDRQDGDLKLVLGFPDWVFWGIVVPWITCTVVSCVFGAVYVSDGNLGADLEDTDDLGLGG